MWLGCLVWFVYVCVCVCVLKNVWGGIIILDNIFSVLYVFAGIKLIAKGEHL